MPVSVALYDKALDRLRPKIDALGLDISLHPFNADGQFITATGTSGPSDTAIDYLWLSPDLSRDGVLGNAFTLAENCRRLRVLQTFNAGLDAPAYKRISDNGIRICNSSAQAVAISEYILAEILTLFHPVETRRQAQAAKKWQRTPFREIAGTNWLIIGFGPIGRATARLAKAFGASTTVIRRTPETSDTVDRSGTLDDLPSYLPDADVIVIACPLNAETRGLANETFFNAVQPGAVLVNIARGLIVDDAALLAALDEGKLDTAILDVFHTEPLPEDDPLWSHPRIRLTAHTSFAGSGGPQRWDNLFLDNLPRFVAGEPLINEVDPTDI